MPYSALTPEDRTRLDEAMRQAGYVKRDDNGDPTSEKDWKRLGAVVSQIMIDGHVVNTRDRLAKGSVGRWELFRKVFDSDDLDTAGVDAEDRDDVVAGTLADKVWGAASTGHNSPAQLAAFAEGLVVCEGAWKLPNSTGDLVMTRKRFLSKNADLIMDFYVTPIADSMINYFSRTNSKIRVPLERIEGMEERIAEKIFEAVVGGARKLEAIKDVMTPIAGARMPKALGGSATR